MQKVTDIMTAEKAAEFYYWLLDKLVDRNSQLMHEQNRLLRELEELKPRGNQ